MVSVALEPPWFLLVVSAAIGIALLVFVFCSDVWDEHSGDPATVRTVLVTPVAGGLLVDAIVEDDPGGLLGRRHDPVTFVVPLDAVTPAPGLRDRLSADPVVHLRPGRGSTDLDLDLRPGRDHRRLAVVAIR